MKNNPSRKIKGATPDGRRAIFRRTSPIMLTIWVTMVVGSALLFYGVIIWHDDFAFTFAIAALALLFTCCVQLWNIYKEQRLNALSICAKIESIKINNNRFVQQSKMLVRQI